MRFFVTLSYILATSFSVASAASIYSQTGAQSEKTGSVITRQDAQSSFADGGFENDPSTSPWKYNFCARRGDADGPSSPHSGSHYAMLEVGLATTECPLPHEVELARGTEYELTFYERIPFRDGDGPDCTLSVIIEGLTVWETEFSGVQSNYEKRTTQFIWDGKEGNGELRFNIQCFRHTVWAIDDVSFTEVLPMKTETAPGPAGSDSPYLPITSPLRVTRC
ncbi:hypothetical protein DL96DRAFT_210255 [Flagelloscypha sp. PMI_526]|nr:hypothetical protein DL96DRAFT_210255 [Flagelloscypha sp. PMI_526]